MQSTGLENSPVCRTAQAAGGCRNMNHQCYCSLWFIQSSYRQCLVSVSEEMLITYFCLAFMLTVGVVFNTVLQHHCSNPQHNIVVIFSNQGNSQDY